MKSFFLTLAALIFISSAHGQTAGQITSNQVGGGGTNNAVISYLLVDIKSGNEKRKDEQYEIQGSAYTSNKFLPGKLLYKDKIQSNVFYRYNAYAEEIEMKSSNISGAPVKGLNRDKEIYIETADGKSISFKTFIDKKKLTQNGYLSSLNDGDYKFYKRVDVKYTAGQKAQNSFVKATPARFSQFTEYYLEVPGKNRIDQLIISNKKLIKLIPEAKQEDLKNYLKENKIKVKKEVDVISVLNWLEQTK